MPRWSNFAVFRQRYDKSSAEQNEKQSFSFFMPRWSNFAVFRQRYDKSSAEQNFEQRKQRKILFSMLSREKIKTKSK